MFDIIVPTFNRPDDIAVFVREIKKQTEKDYKVFIIDDCGEQSPAAHIPADDDRFVYRRLPENKGQAFARNKAIEMSVGEIIISMDDDAWFENENALSRMLEYFNKYPDAGCIMFNVRTPERKYLHEEKNLQDGAVIGGHITCGCAYRREIIEKIGGFGGFLHSQAEEVDLTLKIFRLGYTIRFAKEIPVFHNYQPGVRTDKWYYQARFNTCRNDLLIVWMRYPAIFILPFFFGKFLGHFRFVLRNKRQPLRSAGQIIKALFNATGKIPLALRHRNALNMSQFKQWYSIRW